MIKEFINQLKLTPEDDDHYDYENEYENVEEERRIPEEPKRREIRAVKTTNFPQKTEFIIAKPKKVEDAREIIDQLINGNSVTVDLCNVADEEKQRVLDMVVGYCYSSDCNMEKVNTDIFLVSHSIIKSL